jgi:hypothetical protein
VQPITVVVNALEAAEKRLGMEELAIRLKAPATTVRAWRMGHATMPERKFVMLIDILASIEPTWTESSSSSE